jgi:hypothetical protein
MVAMSSRDGDGGAARVLGLPTDGLQQQAGDGLAMLVGISQADEQAN